MNVHPHVGAHPHWRRKSCRLFGGGMGSAVLLATVLLPLWTPTSLFADTNYFFSPTVSYLYSDGAPVSPVVSYQYLEWPGRVCASRAGNGRAWSGACRRYGFRDGAADSGGAGDYRRQWRLSNAVAWAGCL